MISSSLSLDKFYSINKTILAISIIITKFRVISVISINFGKEALLMVFNRLMIIFNAYKEKNSHRLKWDL